METIISTYECKDIETLRKLKKTYKECLKFLNENGIDKYRESYILSSYIDENDARIQLTLNIKACNEYINALK